MKPVTFYVVDDELAWNLREQNLVRPPTHQWHRWQIITVIRNDRLAEHWTDLGPAEMFPAPQIEIPSLKEHTVAELKDMAQRWRHEEGGRKRIAELQAESTLRDDIMNQFEEGKRIMANQSVFGPALAHQRNGLDRRAFRELTGR